MYIVLFSMQYSESFFNLRIFQIYTNIIKQGFLIYYRFSYKNVIILSISNHKNLYQHAIVNWNGYFWNSIETESTSVRMIREQTFSYLFTLARKFQKQFYGTVNILTDNDIWLRIESDLQVSYYIQVMFFASGNLSALSSRKKEYKRGYL